VRHMWKDCGGEMVAFMQLLMSCNERPQWS
jgi:hypothetical protein